MKPSMQRNPGLPAQASGNSRRRLRRLGLLAVGASVAAAIPVGAGIASAAQRTAPVYRTWPHATYRQHNLVSDIPGVARLTDPHLVDPWGAAEPPNGPLWVADAVTGVATVYRGDLKGSPLAPASLVVKVPGPGPGPSLPTGQVFNGGTGFIVSSGSHNGPARFIFDTINGQISGWNPAVGAASGTSTTAEVAASVPGAAYTGLAIAGDELYAADFATGHVDVFNSGFKQVVTAGAFTDPRVPQGYSAYNTASIDGDIYVTYAKVNPRNHQEATGPGLGYVDVYSRQGTLLRRLIKNGALNAPWGITIAPAHFGAFSNDLLVGNFGDGAINAYNPRTGAFLGPLKNADGNPIAIDRLWALIPGDSAAGTKNTVFFTAGIGGENHGLLGAITAG
jgi:uncharacterized protein (TIGR03118 family)